MFDPWVGQIPWRRAWHPTIVFLLVESQGERSLVSHSLWDHKESDLTEQLTLWLCSLESHKSTFASQLRDSFCCYQNVGVGCRFLPQCMKSESEVTQSCLTLRDPMDCSLPGFPIYGIFQARVLEWGAIAFSVCMQIYTSKKDRCSWNSFSNFIV